MAGAAAPAPMPQPMLVRFPPTGVPGFDPEPSDIPIVHRSSKFPVLAPAGFFAPAPDGTIGDVAVEDVGLNAGCAKESGRPPP